MKNNLLPRLSYVFAAVFIGLLSAFPALAQQGVEDIAENIQISSSRLPGLVTAFMYLAGIYLGYLSIVKAIDHVNNPNQTPLRVPLIRFLAGGALFSAPMVYETMHEAINRNSLAVGVDPFTLFNSMSAFMGAVTGIGGANVNGIMQNIATEVDELPGLVTAVAYLLGILMGAIGIIKIKDHVEDPARVSLKEGVINLLVGGGMFALPAVFESMYATIGGAGAGV